MLGGKPEKIRFKYTGPSIEAALDTTTQKAENHLTQVQSAHCQGKMGQENVYYVDPSFDQ